MAIRAAPIADSTAGDHPSQVVPHCYLIADVLVARDPHAALAALGPTVESIIDLMSFEMGVAIGLGEAEVLDITEPVGIGDERAVAIFAGSPFDRHARQVEMQAVRGLLFGRLPDLGTVPDTRVAAALRWFVKLLPCLLRLATVDLTLRRGRRCQSDSSRARL